MGPQITIDRFTFQYFETGPPVFSDFSLKVPAGSCCALLGPTGAGKTSLLEILSGVTGAQCKTALARGLVRVGKDEFDPLPTSVLFPRVGLVLQDPEVQISGIRETVRSEIEFTLENLHVPPSDRESRVNRILERLHLSRIADRHPFRISGGEMQRVALASILVAEPPALLLDEPAHALDSRSQLALKYILRSLRHSSTILLADTSLEFALGLADLFIILEKGSTRFVGSERELLDALGSFDDLLPVDSWKELRERGTIRDLIGRNR